MYQYDDKASETKNIAMALYAIADELYRLGTTNASTPMGAMEFHTKEMVKTFEGISSSLDGIASAIDDAAKQPNAV